MGTCKDQCLKFESVIQNQYKHGIVRCDICEIFFKYAGRFCPCCSHRVRKSAKYGKARNFIRY